MLAFKKGNHTEGRRLYKEAIEQASRAGSRVTAARAAFHLVYEELMAHASNVGDSIETMKEFDDQREVAELAQFFERVNTLLHLRGADAAVE
jgi:benzoyl-CoA reductase/2-hydroxyglutaryl-CoA dehydratase subunit BcrC/BadD/HgdB